MEKQNNRTLSPPAQYELRKMLIRFRQKGMTNQEAAEAIGISETHASRIWQTFQRDGKEAIKPKVRGRRIGTKRRLSAEQETAIQKLLIDKTPDQLKLSFALWTREAVRLVINQRYRIDLPVRTVSEYLKRWGFTPQKPAKRAYEQDPQKITHWLENDYPDIAARAKREKAEIHWGDETGIQNNAYNAKGFSPKGIAPIIRLNAKKCSVNMISAITNLGKLRFMLYREKMTGKVLIKFLSRLVRDSKQKIFLILDNLKVHHGKIVAAWIEKNKEKIELFFLPPYAPEHNPDEYLNGDLKHFIHSGIPARSQNELIRKTHSFMKTKQHRKYHVRNYFNHPLISYAASSDI
jgi:transposase